MTPSRSFRLAIAAGLLALGPAAQAASMIVYKTESCGCCAKWVEHVRKHGFTVKTVNVDDIMAVKAKAGIPAGLESCHTGIAGGYVIEGHVPAADIRTLLASKPRARGLVVAGMPLGSPGMEAGARRQPYSVLLLNADGSTSVFAKH